jgi:hypothetical protein
MLDPTTFSQVITQAIHCDNHIFEHHQEKRWEPLPIQKKFMAPLPSQLFLSTRKDDLMQIDEMKFKPLTK